MTTILTATWFPHMDTAGNRCPSEAGTLVRDLDGVILLSSSTLPKAIEWAKAFDVTVHEVDYDLQVTIDVPKVQS